MKNDGALSELEREIRSLPEPDYDKKFSKETQYNIHNNLLQFARSYGKKKKRAALMKRISIGLASVAAVVLLAILTLPLNDDSRSGSEPAKQEQQSKEQPAKEENKVDQDAPGQTVSENESTETDPSKEPAQQQTETIAYENNEYGFSFTLPKSWEGYQIVTGPWEGISDGNEVIGNGKILSIRHPEWTEEKPKQDIPIMIFTLEQWSLIENRGMHIGAAPVGPTLLGQNNKYAFALPARYNFAFPDGYEEMEKIIEGKPLQAKNVE